MDVAIKYHDSVVSADGQSLGVAQRLFHYDGDDFLGTNGHRNFLKTFDFETGDDFYIPIEYVKSRDDAANTVQLSLKYGEVQNRSFTREPASVAYKLARVEELPE